MIISKYLPVFIWITKDIALKMVTESTYVLQKTLSALNSLNFRLLQQKIRKMTKKQKKIQHFAHKNS